MFKLLIPSLFALIMAPKSVKMVQEGSLGIKKCFGKVIRDRATGQPKIYGPGLRFIFPGILRIEQRHVLEQSVRCLPQEVMMQDHTIFVVSAYIRFQIDDVYLAIIQVKNLEQTLEDECRGIIRNLLSQTDHDKIHFNGDITGLVITELDALVTGWGVKLLSLMLMNSAPSPESAPVVMMGSRLQALRRVAEELQTTPDALASSPLGPLVAGIAVAVLPNQRSELALPMLDVPADSLEAATDLAP